MFILREASLKDIQEFYELSLKSGPGLTGLPSDRVLLEQKLHLAEVAFNSEVTKPGPEFYVFCLERLADRKVIGTSMIKALHPETIPLPYFNKYPEQNYEMLHYTVEKEPLSELCGLYLDPAERTQGTGKLLSLGRFLYISDHLHRFTNRLYAEIRGSITDDGKCPFWDGILRPFFNLCFKEGSELYIKHLEKFNQRMPLHPIYFDLLPETVKNSIGKCHPKSIPALNFLVHEGFELTPLIHPLDGGPRIEALVKNILTVQRSEIFRIGRIEKISGESDELISTTGSTFKATIGPFKIIGSLAIIDPMTAKALDLQPGDLCRAIKIHH